MSSAQSMATGAAETLSRRAWGTLLVLCGAIFLDALDVSMIGVALPSIRTDLGMSTSSLQWVVSGYVLGYGGFLLLGGRAADLFGRRQAFLISLGVFVVASAGAAVLPCECPLEPPLEAWRGMVGWFGPELVAVNELAFDVCGASRFDLVAGHAVDRTPVPRRGDAVSPAVTPSATAIKPCLGSQPDVGC